MPALFDNVLTDLSGPVFAVLYSVWAMFTLGAVLLRRTAIDPAGKSAPTAGIDLDPYEVAYLRGGRRAVASMLLDTLFTRGLLKRHSQTGAHWMRRSGMVIERTDAAVPGDLTSLEEEALALCFEPRLTSEFLTAADFQRLLSRACAVYQAELERREFAPSVRQRWELRILGLTAFVMLSAPAMMRLIGADASSRTSHSVMTFVWLASLVALWRACTFNRLTRSGVAHLNRLRVSMMHLRGENRPTSMTPYDAVNAMLLGVFGYIPNQGGQGDHIGGRGAVRTKLTKKQLHEKQTASNGDGGFVAGADGSNYHHGHDHHDGWGDGGGDGGCDGGGGDGGGGGGD